MKRVVVLLFLGAFILASCEKDPDFSKLDEEFVVLTKYDNTYNFKNNAKTFYISDTITVISADATNPKWSNSQSAQIISQIRTNLESLGYTYVPFANIEDADGNFTPQYLVSVTAVKDMNTVIYSYDPYWYWDYYPYYWWWGGYYPYYPYYPWATGYTYDVGTTLIDMIDMQAAPYAEQGETGGHPIRWNAIMGGLLNTGNDQLYEQEAIDDAFKQSPYLSVK